MFEVNFPSMTWQSKRMEFSHDKAVLHNLMRFKRTLFPKYFYLILFTASLILQLMMFRAEVITLFYTLTLGINIIAAAAFLYEAMAALSKARIY